MAVFPQEDREHVLIASAPATDFHHWSDLQDRHTLRMVMGKRMPKLWKALFDMQERLHKVKGTPPATEMMRLSGFSFADRYALPSMGIDLRNIEILGAIVCASSRAKGFRLLLFMDESIYSLWGKDFAVGIVEIPVPGGWDDADGFFLSSKDKDIAAQMVDYSFGKASYGDRHEQLADLTRLYDLKFISDPRELTQLGMDGQGFRHIQLGVGRVDELVPPATSDAQADARVPERTRPQEQAPQQEEQHPPLALSQVDEGDFEDYQEEMAAEPSPVAIPPAHPADDIPAEAHDDSDGFSDYEDEFEDVDEDDLQAEAIPEEADEEDIEFEDVSDETLCDSSVDAAPSQPDVEVDEPDYDDSIGSFHRPAEWATTHRMPAWPQQGQPRPAPQPAAENRMPEDRRIAEIAELSRKMDSWQSRDILDAVSRISDEVSGTRGLGKRDDYVPMAFALLCQHLSRCGKPVPSAEQIGQALRMHDGRPVSMHEGREVPVLLVAFFAALCGRQTHVMSTDRQFIRTASSDASDALGGFGISVSRREDDKAPLDEHRYQADVIYGTPDGFGSDYLRCSVSDDPSDDMWMRLDLAIVDGATDIMDENGDMSFSIKGTSSVSDGGDYRIFSEIVKGLRYSLDPNAMDCDIAIDMARKKISIRASGATRLKERVRQSNLTGDYDAAELTRRLQCALQAEYLLKRDIDYVVANGSICLRDPRTGMVLRGRKWSGGLHQAVEAKEGLSVHEPGAQIASMTVSEYLHLYGKVTRLN